MNLNHNSSDELVKVLEDFISSCELEGEVIPMMAPTKAAHQKGTPKRPKTIPTIIYPIIFIIIKLYHE